MTNSRVQGNGIVLAILFRQITAGQLIKVEQNRDVRVCAQSFTEDIEDGFTPGREASKNENGFLGNRVDQSTNFLVVE